MSKSTQPSDMMTSETPFAAFTGGMTEMQKDAIDWMASATGPQFAGVANLAAHPMGAMAAASALSLGMASQMFGFFAGTMAGAMQAANMLANETTGGHSELYGLANPLDFDLATGTFDETKEPDRVAAKPAEAKVPAVKKAKAPVEAVTAKPEPVKAAPKKAEAKKAAEKAAAKPAAKAAPVKAAPEPVALAEAVVEAPAEAAVASGKIAPVMPEDFIKPKPMAKPDAPDDLKVISGIGPKLEGVLNSLGIWTYGQIAGWTPYEIAWVDDYLQFKGRIDRDEWVSQAAGLAGKAKG